jgi:hypothetical protein
MFTNEIVPSLVFVVLFIGAVFGLLMLLARLEQGLGRRGHPRLQRRTVSRVSTDARPRKGTSIGV